MTSELVVDVSPKEVTIAVLEDKKLIELQQEKQDEYFTVGNIYLGKVKRIMPALNAAFVNVGHKKDAFLHYLDLGPGFNSLQKFQQQASQKKKVPQLQKMTLLPKTDKQGSITDLLKVGQDVLVQITKEPISTKGARLSSEITFAGRFLVLLPFSNRISVSQKIKSRGERVRLRQLIRSIKPHNFGVIIRTNAAGMMVADLDAELKVLVKRWTDNIGKIVKVKTPALIYEETGRAVALLRDIFNPSFTNIYVNDEAVCGQITEYVAAIAPGKQNIVKHYKGNLPILDKFEVTKQIKSLFGKTVSFKGGGYLIIEHTEALHSIDVNSGTRNKSNLRQEDSAYQVNLIAAEEIARQLRLRDMGGIIVVDFIDMNKGAHRNDLYLKMREFMKGDRARHKILPLSKFGLMQITRQRVRPEMEVATGEVCPTCFGKGKIKSSFLFTDTLERKVKYLVKDLKVKRFTLHIHPYVAAYIQQGLFSLKYQWRRRYGASIRIVPNQKLGFLQYIFYDRDGNEIDLKEEIEMK